MGSLEPETPGLKSDALPTGLPRPNYIHKSGSKNNFKLVLVLEFKVLAMLAFIFSKILLSLTLKKRNKVFIFYYLMERDEICYIS